MSRWSNPFVSLGGVLLVAACQNAPPAAPARAEDAFVVPQPAGAAAPATAGPAAAAPNGAPNGAPAAPPAPVPARAEQQYADALRLAKSGHTQDAVAQFKQLADAYPDLAGPQVNLGLLYLQGAQLPDAEAAFKNVLLRNPDNAVADNELGIVERRLGKFPDAEAAYQRAIAARPDYAPAYLNLGVLYDLYLAEPQKALEQFEHYLALAGDNKQVAGWVVELKKRVGAPAAPAAKKEPA